MLLMVEGVCRKKFTMLLYRLFDWECEFCCCCFQVHAVVGVLGDDTDPMVTVMKLEKAPQETYADIGGLDQQIQEIKVNQNYFCHLIRKENLLLESNAYFIAIFLYHVIDIYILKNLEIHNAY